jgi:hypothetical protein
VSRVLRYVLLGDGGRDAALGYVIDWAIRSLDSSVTPERAAFRKHSGAIEASVADALRRYEPEMLFVHRDAEGLALDARRAEIPLNGGRIVRVVPVRMTEAWLLIDEAAVRRAAGNRNGTMALGLPQPADLEDLTNPKATLFNTLVTASGFTSGRRRKRFNRDEAEWPERLASLIGDFTPLRQLPAFLAFESELKLQLKGWLDVTRINER